MHDVADGVIDVSDRYDGIVVSSQVSENAEGRSTAHIELAIPADGLQDALADLSELADVSSRSESAMTSPNRSSPRASASPTHAPSSTRC